MTTHFYMKIYELIINCLFFHQDQKDSAADASHMTLNRDNIPGILSSSPIRKSCDKIFPLENSVVRNFLSNKAARRIRNMIMQMIFRSEMTMVKT